MVVDTLSEFTKASDELPTKTRACVDETAEFEILFPDYRLEFKCAPEEEGNDNDDALSTCKNGVCILPITDRLHLSDYLNEALCHFHEMFFDENDGVVEDSYRILMFRICYIVALKANKLYGGAGIGFESLSASTSGHAMALSLASPSSPYSIPTNRISGNNLDFHRDPNPKESIKAAAPLIRLLAKVSQLLCLFPENEILLEIARVCDRVRKLDILSTALGKYMTGLEVVLKHAQDWEQHASVRVRLGEPLFDVRRVVSSWRKLELQSWPWLLQSREESFKMNGRKHWIRIHQIVRKFIVNH